MTEAKQPQSPEVAAAEEIHKIRCHCNLCNEIGRAYHESKINDIAAIIARHCRVAEKDAALRVIADIYPSTIKSMPNLISLAVNTARRALSGEQTDNE